MTNLYLLDTDQLIRHLRGKLVTGVEQALFERLEKLEQDYKDFEEEFVNTIFENEKLKTTITDLEFRIVELELEKE